jgi:hypothetical protein
LAVGAALMAVVATGLGAWSFWPGHRPAVVKTPFSVIMDCEHYNLKTGRVLMKLTVTSRVAHPLRFRGHVIVAIRRILSGDNWARYAHVSANTPLTTIQRARRSRGRRAHVRFCSTARRRTWSSAAVRSTRTLRASPRNGF